MNIKKLNETLEKLLQESEDISVDLIPDSDDPDVIDNWMNNKYQNKSATPKTSEAINKLRNVIKNNNQLINTVIAQEFLDDDIIESDDDVLYFNGAEMIPQEVSSQLTDVCKQIILSSIQRVDIQKIKTTLKLSMESILDAFHVNEKFIQKSDDATEQAIQSLQAIPVLVEELCQSLNSSTGTNLVYFINKTPIFKEALQIANDLSNSF